MRASYTFDDLVITTSDLAMDFGMGFNFGNVVDLSYTLRTNFETLSNKVSLGFVYRFRKEDSL